MSLNKKKEISYGISIVLGMNELIISDVISRNENKSCGCALGNGTEIKLKFSRYTRLIVILYRLKDPIAEENIRKAPEGVTSGTYRSTNRIAKELNTAVSTTHRRKPGRISRDQSRQEIQNLRSTEE